MQFFLDANKLARLMSCTGKCRLRKVLLKLFFLRQKGVLTENEEQEVYFILELIDSIRMKKH